MQCTQPSFRREFRAPLPRNELFYDGNFLSLVIERTSERATERPRAAVAAAAAAAAEGPRV
jgi:hypothetical protein